MDLKAAPEQSLNQTLFRSELVEIGLFDCPRDHPRFHDSGPISHYLLVFPRQAVRIRHSGHREVVANSQVITLYNKGQEYRREGLSHYGDQSIWLGFRKPEVIEALHAAGRAHSALEKAPFVWTHAHCEPDTYLLHRQLSRSLLSSRDSDFLAIPETAMQLLQRAVCGTGQQKVICRQTAVSPGTRERHRKLVDRCEALLSTRYEQVLTLESMASELATTPFHLSRVFSRRTGKSIHQYLLQMRLRAAMDRMISSPRDRLTDIGLEVGFATPSHFSQSFRKNFGVSPRQFRS